MDRETSETTTSRWRGFDTNPGDNEASLTQPTQLSSLVRSLDLPAISVVIPTLNEARNLPHVLPYIPDWVHEVIIVDGASSDDTVAVARALRPDVYILVETRRGKGRALRTGFEAVTGDIVVMLDADGSMDPREIPRYIGALLSGSDFVKGSRFLQGGGTSDMPRYRQLGNWGLLMIVRILFGSRYSDLCYGYTAFWSHVLPKLNLNTDGFEIETLMNVRALRAKLKVMEVASFETERIYGNSNLQAFPDGWRILKTILREFMSQYRGNKITGDAETSKDEFTSALQLLMHEANLLAQKRASLPSAVFHQSTETLRQAKDVMLSMEISDPNARNQQAWYRDYGDRAWSFLEVDKK